MSKHHIPVVFVHGLGSSKSTWKLVLQELQSSFACYAVDLRGHGASPMGSVEAISDISMFAEDLKKFAEANKINQAIWVGHSFGARVIVTLADEHPHLCRALILSDMDMVARTPYPFPDGAEAAYLLAFKKEFPSKSELYEAMEEYYKFSPERVEEDIEQERILHDSATGCYTVLRDPYVEAIIRSRVMTSREPLESFKRVAGRGIPMCLLLAETGSACSAEGLKQMQDIYPALQVIHIPGSTHRVHRTVLHAFLNALTPVLHLHASVEEV